MIARIVKQEHTATGFDIAAQHVPTRHDQLIARVQDLGVRHATGGDDHHLGRFGQDLRCVGPDVESERHARGFALRDAPIDDAHHLAAAVALCGQAELPTGFGRRLPHRHPVPTGRGHPRGLEAGRASPDHQDWRTRSARGMSCGMRCSRPVAGLWMQ